MLSVVAYEGLGSQLLCEAVQALQARLFTTAPGLLQKRLQFDINSAQSGDVL